MLLIQPIIALIVWTMVMWVWLYATRLPAIAARKMKMDPDAPAGQQMAQLPARVRWKADNYNNLLEQPTLFYAVTLSLVFLEAATDTNIYAAWAYVGLRIVHSLVQALVNNVEIRFALFMLSNIPLIVLVVNAVRLSFEL